MEELAMTKFFAMCLVAASATSMTVAVDAQTTQTITVKKNVVKMTHQQCVIERMAHAKTDQAKANAETWCTARGDTVPRKW
jgi:hypothetical protein